MAPHCILIRGPFHKRFFHHNSNSMEISLSSNSITDDHIATKFGTCHDSPAVVPCAKYCSDHFISIWMGAKWNFHHIWIVMERLLVKWAPGPEISISQSHQFLPTSSTKSNIILLPLCLCRWREQPVVWHRILRRRSPSIRTYCWLSTWGPSDECHTETQDPSKIIHWSLGDAVAILNRYFSN